MYHLYNRDDDNGVFDVLRSIQQLTPGFQPEPKIKLVEQVLIHPWSNHS
ncbi:hypothetical protein LEP1GSC176_0446 [Leptospira kirschneri str. MMD1493]|nr:hypothetical protein LEP1GSC176_0446 [Leptospira kirschneri str. MMD1493]